MVKFILNNQTVSPLQSQGSTVLDYIRYVKRLTGTKIGCREGDCGACTVLAGSFEEGNLVYRSMTSCLMPLANAAGKHIVTVEGINRQKLSPVQQAMVDTNGTQCGFCTLGFVMSFTGFVMNEKSRTYEDAIASIDGNICRCTGYKSIERSAKIIADAIAEKPSGGALSWAVTNNFLPDYFLSIEQRLKDIRFEKNREIHENGSVEKAVVLAGGTDMLVQRPLTVKQSAGQFLFDEEYLKGISSSDGLCVVGGGVTVTEFLESPIIQHAFPDLATHLKLVSSTPIRNMATMAGNIVNASPIGDMTVFFLALNANLVLVSNGGERTVALKDFYKGYKQTDKKPNELITRIIFNLPSAQTYFNFEKVSKRTNLDIASVNSACRLTMTADGSIESIHLSAGGVAPFPKYLGKTCAYLQGQKPETKIVQEALKIAGEEVAPISDARGSREYKHLLLRQLILAHFLKFFGVTDAIKQALFQ